MHLAEGELLRSQWGEGDYLGKVLEIGKQSVRFHWGEVLAGSRPRARLGRAPSLYDVHGGAGQPPGIERIGEIPLVDQAAPGGVDEKRRGLHARK